MTSDDSRRSSARAKRNGPEMMGHLHNDLTATASTIFRASVADTVSVWVDDQGMVYGSPVAGGNEVPAHWMVGTFAAGTSIEAIADDLRAMLRERAKNWIVD